METSLFINISLVFWRERDRKEEGKEKRSLFVSDKERRKKKKEANEMKKYMV